MTNPVKKRPTESKPEQKKKSAPSPETMKVETNPKVAGKVKFIPHLELSLVATVLDFASND